MGKILVKVAIWSSSIPVYKNPKGEGLGLFGVNNLDLPQRLSALKEVLDKARTWLDDTTSALPVLKVFVAPEYLLLKSSEEKAVSFKEFQLAASEFQLEAWSKGLLFIPGTVVWKKPTLEQDETSSIDRRAKLASKLDKHKQRLESYYTHRSGGLGSITQGLINSKQETLKGKLDTLQEVEQGGFIARNVAYIYHDGTLLMGYKKQSEFKHRTPSKKTAELTPLDKSSSERIKFIPGYKDGRFEVQVNESTRVRCGIEICADHAAQQVKHAGDGKELDLQILLSDYISNIPLSVAVKQGGYVVHASTDPDYSGVYDKQLKRVAGEEPVSLTYGKLCYSSQELDV